MATTLNQKVYICQAKNQRLGLLRFLQEKSYATGMLRDIKAENLKRILGDRHGSRAELTRNLGCTPQYINKLVNRGGGISDEKAVEIARALRVPVKALYEGSEFEPTQKEGRGRRDIFAETCYRFRDDEDFKKIVAAFVACKSEPADLNHAAINKIIETLLDIVGRYAEQFKGHDGQHGTDKPARHSPGPRKKTAKAKK